VSYENILYAVEAGVATITLHRPDKLNAYTTERGDEIVGAFTAARDDASVGPVGPCAQPRVAMKGILGKKSRFYRLP
jgi:1,4-dihydroxy-2-naphthoyl-CoA synthase